MSEYIGVYYNTQQSNWVAEIKYNSETFHLGYFSDRHNAALAYNQAALTLFEEFALLNIVEWSDEECQSRNYAKPLE